MIDVIQKVGLKIVKQGLRYIASTNLYLVGDFSESAVVGIKLEVPSQSVSGFETVLEFRALN
jgi:hypothetical protein